MIHIDDYIYRELAENLMKTIEGKSYFNGSVTCCGNGFSGTLKVTLIIFNDPDRNHNIVPVWWEFVPDGTGSLDYDFSWMEFREFLEGGSYGP